MPMSRPEEYQIQFDQVYDGAYRYLDRVYDGAYRYLDRCDEFMAKTRDALGLTAIEYYLSAYLFDRKRGYGAAAALRI
jgi:hypothetical protein